MQAEHQASSISHLYVAAADSHSSASSPPSNSAKVLGIALGVLALATAMPVAAAPINYVANLTPLNNSGVSATYNLSLDGALLTVTAQASGLEPNMPHPQHIHGLLGAAAPMTSTPTLAQDDDGDGFIELGEGLETYGPILLDLTSPPGGALSGFPTAPGGSFTFSQTYNLADASLFSMGISMADLLPLTDREIVLHGITVAPGIGAGTPGEVNGNGGYLAVLPVAAGQIELAQVPEPMSMMLLTVGVAGTLVATRMRRRRSI